MPCSLLSCRTELSEIDSSGGGRCICPSIPARPCNSYSRISAGTLIICLDTYMPSAVYQERGHRLRNHRGAEPPRDIEPSGLVAAVGGTDRASAPYVAADRVKASAGAARGRFRGVHRGRTAPSLSVET